jgi:hypothetical protein
MWHVEVLTAVTMPIINNWTINYNELNFKNISSLGMEFVENNSDEE